MKRICIEIAVVFLLLATLGCSSVTQRQYDLYYRIGDWEGAERVLKKALQEEPDDPEVYFLLGQAYGYGGKYTEMDEAFRKSLSLTGGYEAEIEQLRDYYVITQLNRGIENYNRGAYEAAIDELLPVPTIDPEESRHYRYLGLSYSKLGEYAEAARNLEESAERNGDLESKIELARVYNTLGQDRNVMEVSEEILEEEPDHLDILRLAAVACDRAGEPERAIEHYEKIVERTPGNADALYNLALLLCRVDRKDDAVPILGELTAQEPDSLDLRYSVCSLLYETGRFEESRVCFEGYLERDPVDIQALRHLFVLNQRLSRWEETKEIKRRLEALDTASIEMGTSAEEPRKFNNRETPIEE